VTSSLDVIGDVHGQYDKLVVLLLHLGYRDIGGAWGHPSRSVIFLGDLIDRGPKQLATVDLVRRMVEAGARMAFVFRDAVKPSVAAASETPVSHAPENKHPSACGCTVRARHRKLLRWLRDPDCHRMWQRTESGRRVGPARLTRRCRARAGARTARPDEELQHQAFLDVVEGTHLQKEITDWFKTLPLWFDLDLRQDVATDEVREASRARAPDSPSRGEGRKPEQPGPTKNIPDLPMPAEWVGHPYSGPPVLFGHYWFTGKPEVISPRFACLDYSAARDGLLVAYRFDGEKELTTEKMAWI
jgi:hypothetical protein